MSQAHDKLIGPVPSRILDTAHFIVTPYEGRVAEFNIAAWLQIPGLGNLPVSLMVNYRDGERRREVTVDHGKVGGTDKILLSGVARLPVKVKLEDVQVRLRSAVPASALIVEELFVQAVEMINDDSRQVTA
ncbi:MAG: hypothetical protein ABWY06_12495 [Pseudomonas sp.]|uniref:hypothetical protein n=1 Tax=Pseudomonas sp. TaxID=306 RepID=UPI003397E1FF